MGVVVDAASPGGPDALEDGQALYDQGDFAKAAKAFETALTADPEDPRTHLWLGRAYGRQAERAGWLQALPLARQTRRHFEKAVALAPDYVPAVEALIRYYAGAPPFLGGGDDKARRLLERLDRLDPTRAADLRDELNATRRRPLSPQP
jgi:tetratricopeptide (TPR) repeat protein